MKRHRSLRLFVAGCGLALFAVTFASAAAAATTRYASPAGLAMQSDCTDINTPCTLPVALEAARAGDTLSVTAGTYNVGRMGLPPVPLHWRPTDPRTRPVITSPLAIPTLDLTAAQSGTSFDGLEIDNTDVASPLATPALQVEAGVAAAVRSSVLNGTRCVEAPMAGALEIDDSTLTTIRGDTFCLHLGALSTVRRSTVDSLDHRSEFRSAVVFTDGVVEDSQITGGLRLDGPLAVARRVRVVGAAAIAGEGLVVDSVAHSFGADLPAIVSDTDGGGTLRVVNSTAISTGGPALVAQVADSSSPGVVPNELVVSNSIARGATTDLEAQTNLALCPDPFCDIGIIRIDHSDFVTRAPLAGAPDSVVISEGAGNITGDPRFANAFAGDYHLLLGSPAIDAGATLDLAFPTDLDGTPRVQGAGPDIGAFETTPPVSPPASTASATAQAGGISASPADRTAPVLGPVRLSPARFRVAIGNRAVTSASRRTPIATTVTTTISEAAPVSFAVQEATAGRRSGGACVASTPSLRHAAPCTRWVGRGPAFTRRATAAGRVALLFGGRLGAKRLPPGRYRFAVSAVDAAGNRSATGYAAFTIVT